MDWKTMLSYISGSVDEELLLRNEYLVAENRVLRNQLQGRLRLTDGERRSLAEIGKRLGKQALDEVASIVNPDTILGWHRRLVAKKFDGSKNRQYPGRPRIDADIEELVVRLAKENKSWGYDRIAGDVLRRVTLQPAQGGQRFAPGRATTPVCPANRAANDAITRRAATPSRRDTLDEPDRFESAKRIPSRPLRTQRLTRQPRHSRIGRSVRVERPVESHALEYHLVDPLHVRDC